MDRFVVFVIAVAFLALPGRKKFGLPVFQLMGSRQHGMPMPESADERSLCVGGADKSFL